MPYLRSGCPTDQGAHPASQQWKQAAVLVALFDAGIEKNSLEIPDAGRIHQGGIYGYTLCSTCNSLTGARYGGEYKTWVATTMGAMSAMPRPEILNDRVEPLGWQLQLGNKTTGGSSRVHSSVRCFP